MLRLNTVRKIVDILWPPFREYDGAIVLAHGRVPPPAEYAGTLTEYERFYGHAHVEDLAEWSVPYVHDPELDMDVPDPLSAEFAAAWALMQQVGHMWLAKLASDFPGYRFRVYVTKLADPIVHFHRVREGERPWFTDEEAADQVAAGTLLVLDTGPRGLASVEAAI